MAGGGAEFQVARCRRRRRRHPAAGIPGRGGSRRAGNGREVAGRTRGANLYPRQAGQAANRTAYNPNAKSRQNANPAAEASMAGRQVYAEAATQLLHSQCTEAGRRQARVVLSEANPAGGTQHIESRQQAQAETAGEPTR